jgi:hypothetical protein
VREITVRVHAIATDGLPPLNPDGTSTADEYVGRVAFIFDGCIVSGWPEWHTSPTGQPFADTWEADSDVGHNQAFEGVTHWVEFPAPLWEIGP